MDGVTPCHSWDRTAIAARLKNLFPKTWLPVFHETGSIDITLCKRTPTLATSRLARRSPDECRLVQSVRRDIRPAPRLADALLFLGCAVRCHGVMPIETLTTLPRVRYCSRITSPRAVRVSSVPETPFTAGEVSTSDTNVLLRTTRPF